MARIKTSEDTYEVFNQGAAAVLGYEPRAGAEAIIDTYRAKGTTVDDPAEGEPGGGPVMARVDRGRWIGDCLLDVAGSPCLNAQYVTSGDPRFFCVVCANAATAGAWRAVTFPADRGAVEAALEGLPVTQQYWTPES